MRPVLSYFAVRVGGPQRPNCKRLPPVYGKQVESMAIPKYDEMYRVLLDCLADMQPHGSREVRDAIAVRLSVSEAERQELLPSGRQAVFDNRVGWTRTYLKKAGLLTSPGAGFCSSRSWGSGFSNPIRQALTMLFWSNLIPFDSSYAPIPRCQRHSLRRTRTGSRRRISLTVLSARSTTRWPTSFFRKSPSSPRLF